MAVSNVYTAGLVCTYRRPDTAKEWVITLPDRRRIGKSKRDPCKSAFQIGGALADRYEGNYISMSSVPPPWISMVTRLSATVTAVRFDGRPVLIDFQPVKAPENVP